MTREQYMDLVRGPAYDVASGFGFYADTDTTQAPGARRVRFAFSPRRRSCVAFAHRGLIRFGGRCPRVPLHCLAHELAHLVARARHGAVSPHGVEFRRALCETIGAALGGHPDEALRAYDWRREYTTIRRWAERQGLTPKAVVEYSTSLVRDGAPLVVGSCRRDVIQRTRVRLDRDPQYAFYTSFYVRREVR